MRSPWRNVVRIPETVKIHSDTFRAVDCGTRGARLPSGIPVSLKAEVEYTDNWRKSCRIHLKHRIKISSRLPSPEQMARAAPQKALYSGTVNK